jgi:hypothetical protein
MTWLIIRPINYFKDRKASLLARREGIVVSQLKTVLNDKFRAYC